MPDAHLGKGATVGSVLPTQGAIIPAAVGVDIGCGMIAVRTPWSVGRGARPGPLAPLRGDIERAVPLSAGKYNRTLTESAAAPGRRARGAGRGARRATCSRRSSARPRTGRCSWAASGRATTSSRSPPTSRTGCGCSCTPAAAAWATRSPCGTSRSPGAGRAGAAGPARPRPRLARRGDAGVRPVHRRAAVGAALRPAQPRGDDGPGRRLPGRHMRADETPRARADQLPPQLHPAGAALRRRPVGVPARARSRRRRGRPGSSPARWGRRATW